MSLGPRTICPTMFSLCGTRRSFHVPCVGQDGKAMGKIYYCPCLCLHTTRTPPVSHPHSACCPPGKRQEKGALFCSHVRKMEQRSSVGELRRDFERKKMIIYWSSFTFFARKNRTGIEKGTKLCNGKGWRSFSWGEEEEEETRSGHEFFKH